MSILIKRNCCPCRICCCCPCMCERLPRRRCLSDGLQASLTSDTRLISPGARLPFNKTTAISGNAIRHQSNGSFLLCRRGVYTIHWNVTLEGSDKTPYLRFGIRVDEQVMHEAVIPASLQQASGFALINVANRSARVSLVNAGEDIVQLSPVRPCANIMISTLNSN